MNCKNLLIVGLTVLSMPVVAQKTINVTVTNSGKIAKSNQPVVINLDDMGINVRSAVVTFDGTETPCQLDDINRDGRYDELCFLTDVDRKSTKKFSVTLYDKGTPRQYDAKVYAELMLLNRKVKIKNKQDIYISELTVNRGVNPYGAVNHHGAAFENDMLAMRIYFDHRQTVDLYGKFRKGLELKETQFYPSAEQKAAGYGDDVLWVGNSFGLGALRGWDGSQQTLLTDVDYRSQRLIATGPLRTIVEIEDRGWTPQPSLQPVDMKTYYIMYAGRRECDVKVKFNRPVSDYLFATGIVNVDGSTEFTDRKGLRGCWGTAWPVAAKDTANYKRETVGLGIYVPSEYLVSEEKATKEDYPYVVKTSTDELNYKITYCSDNETFGYHTAKDWFSFMKSWKQGILSPVTVKIEK